MAAPKVFNGGRARVEIGGVTVGIFDRVDYSRNISVEPIYILGRFTPAELNPTSVDPVAVNCSGYRVVGKGGFQTATVTQVKDLMNFESVTIVVYDRQTGAEVAKIVGCVATNYSVTTSARQTSRISISYQGAILSEDAKTDSEVSPVELP